MNFKQGIEIAEKSLETQEDIFWGGNVNHKSLF